MEEDYKYFLCIWNINWNNYSEKKLSSFAKEWIENVGKPTLKPIL
jgi:hypothetical protein